VWTSEEVDDDSAEEFGRKISTVSFGSLVKAQDSLSRLSEKRKRDPGLNSDKLEVLRARLRELKSEKEKAAPVAKGRAAGERRKSSTSGDISDEESSDDASDDDGKTTKKRRLSKHAPTVISSKHPVSRKRNVIALPKSQVRDPRFDSAFGSVNRNQVRKNYSFLDDYVDSEIKEIKKTLKDQTNLSSGTGKKRKKKGIEKLSAEEINALKRELSQKESRRAAQITRDRETEVLRDHRRNERDLVKQGKKPFYLKKSEVKAHTIMKQFDGMSEGKREKIMEKKRKRLAAKERKAMPFARRTANSVT
jgi:ribosomal RNA-processing protein 36